MIGRMHPGEMIWTALCLGIVMDAVLWIYFHRKARRSSFFVLGTMPGPVPAISTWFWIIPFYVIMAVTMISPSWLGWAAFDVPGWMRTSGAITVLMTPCLEWWTLSSLGENLTGAFAVVLGQKLVTRGPYRYIRHPLYAVEFLFLAGVTIVTANWIIVAWACSGILMIRLVVIPYEEEDLMRRFGRSYANYVRRTGMLFPKAGLLPRAVLHRAGRPVDRARR